MATATTSASSSPLETLPLLALGSICEYLAHCDSKRCSLFAFSSTSKCCCFAATKQRFERIRFSVRGRKKLRQDLKRWDEILRIDGRAKYVRRVKVVGYMPLLQANEAGEEREVAAAFQPVTFEDEDEDESDSDEDDFCKPSKGLIEEFYGASPLLTHEEKQEQNEAWLPLAQFLDQLPALKDLIYACTDQIPICILSSLHQHHPNSRFHVHTFSLRSLYQPKDRPHDIDPDEFVLATSPCLHSIMVSYSGYDTNGQVEYNEEAVLQMVVAAAPRLNSVRMWHSLPGASLALQNAVRTPRPPWQGFFVVKPGESPELTRSKGRLQSLVLDGASSTNSVQLTAWRNHTDFSQLYSLELRKEVHLEPLRTLTQMAEDGEFESLHTLALSVSPSTHQEQLHMDEAASLLLQTLHPLKDLRLTGFVADRTFTTVLHRHGETLRKLQFIPARQHWMQVEPYVISHRCIQALQKRCPNLREVELLTPRTKGDEQEVSIYRALGTLPRLTRASLLLDCSYLPGLLDNGGSLLVDDEPKASHIREDLMKGAVDSSLALGIFRAISTTTNTLRYLKLQVFGGGGFGQMWADGDFNNIARWIARSWVCARDSGGEVIVREIEKRKRMKRANTEWLEADLEEYYHGKLYKRVWRELWPEERTGDWREDWRSFPLSGEKVRS